MRPIHALFVSCLLILATACSAPRGASINHLIDSDFKGMTASEYASAVKAVGAATKLTYPKVDAKEGAAGREAGPRAVLADGDGAVVVSTLRGAVQITKVNKDGKRVWHHSVTLSKYQVGSAFSITANDDLGLSCLRIPVDMPGCQHLVFALGDKSCALVRVETASGQFAGTAFAKALPIYKYTTAKLEGSKGQTSLEALLRLSSPKAKMERSVAAVRSQLEAFSSSTNSWIAEAAAAVLILPSVN